MSIREIKKGKQADGHGSRREEKQRGESSLRDVGADGDLREKDRVISGRRGGAESDEERQTVSEQMSVLENHSATLDSLRK